MMTNHKITKLEYDLGSAKRIAQLRGRRMEKLMERIKLLEAFYPEEFDTWFYKDGKVK